MLIKYVLAAAFLIPTTVISQIRHSRHFQAQGFSVKTDVLSLFGSILNKELNNYYISGEMYFNYEYSINLDLASESEVRLGLKRKLKRYGSHFRWYFIQDNCNCSAFFIGSYFNLVKEHQSVDRKFLHNNSFSYNRNYFEGGLYGGLQALVARHFVIDPAIQIGMEFPHDIHYTESMSYLPNNRSVGFMVSITLGVGYRF